MGLSAAADVRFDFDASLQLAGRLWALGDEIDDLMSNRVRSARVALTDWLGVYGTQFAERIDSESQQATTIANDLRIAADQWAARWAEAMNEQNRILHARESKRVEDDRNIVDDVVGGLFGHHDLPPDPPEIAPPKSPNYYATGSLTRY